MNEPNKQSDLKKEPEIEIDLLQSGWDIFDEDEISNNEKILDSTCHSCHD